MIRNNKKMHIVGTRGALAGHAIHVIPGGM